MYLSIAILNALVVAYAFGRTVRLRPFLALFWALSAFFAAYPLLIDSILCATDQLAGFVADYEGNTDGVAPVVDSVILTRTSAFVLVFNLCVLLSSIAIDRRLRGRDSAVNSVDDSSAVLEIVNTIVGVGGLAALVYIVEVDFDGLAEALSRTADYFGYGTEVYEVKNRILRLSANTLVYLSPFSAYYGLKTRRPFWVFAGMTPGLAMGYITGQRPWIFGTFGVLIFYAFGPARDLTLRRLKTLQGRFSRGWRFILACALGLALLFSAHFVRLGRTATYSGSSADALVATLANVITLRDVSTWVLYWTIDTIPERLPTTGGMSTLHIPATLLQAPSEFDQMEQVGYYIAWHRSRWIGSTAHPTIYGWAWCDLHWVGIVWSLLIVGILTWIERWTGNRESRFFAAAPVVTMMLAVVVRGSPHYGITRAWYSMLACAAIFALARSMEARKKRLGPADNRARRKARFTGTAACPDRLSRRTARSS